ncbi:MAG: hypothetical protein AB7K64_22195 [Variibacter sp.]
MIRSGGNAKRRTLHRLGWFANGDRLDVAGVANRLAAAGGNVWRCQQPSGAAEAGDYIVEIGSEAAQALRGAGIAVEPWRGARPKGARRIKRAGVAVLAGKASAYPYYGYYALTLARLGYAYAPVDGAEIAAGALDGENVAVLPGGFSNWGLDAKEESSGADAAFRRFLGGRGAALGSCGGAYYLSRGRPAWLGVADARPVFTQEYLRTGVGVVTCALAEGPLRLGLPPTLEIPYFHGPVHDAVGAGCTPLARFSEFYGHGRLFIDNPLSEETFARHMQGRIAALRASGPRGDAILFSPHPEMGDLLRKYMALETYISRYLPIRGETVMRETLASYTPSESRSFLMVLNAVDDLLQNARDAGTRERASVPGDVAGGKKMLAETWQARAALFKPSRGDIAWLERHILSGLTPRMAAAAGRLGDLLTRAAESGGDGPRIARSFAILIDHICASWGDTPQRRPAELLLELELAVLLMEAFVRLSELHILVSAHD